MEAEGYVFVAEVQRLLTRNYQKIVIHDSDSSKSRFYDEKLDTIDNRMSDCSMHTPNEYRSCHKKDGQYLHWKIHRSYSISTSTNWF